MHKELRGMNSLRVWSKTNQGVGVLLTFLFSCLFIYLWFSPWAHRKLQDGFTLGFFPIFGVLILILLTITMAIDAQRKHVAPKMHTMDLKTLFFCLLILLGCWVYFALTDRIGFLLVSPVFLVGYSYSLGMRPWTYAVIAGVAMSTIVYVVFRLLEVELPSGILPF